MSAHRTSAAEPAAPAQRAGSNWLGWVNVVVGAVLMLATLPGRTQGLGLITEPMLRDLQLDRVTYANINLWATLLGAVICLPIGRVFDRAGLYSVALVILPLLTTLAQLWSFAVLIGLSGGMITVMFFAVWRRAFGARHLGRIQGAAQMVTVLASAIGPMIFAQSAAWTGSYFPALWVLAPCVLLFSIAAFRVELPDTRAA